MKGQWSADEIARLRASAENGSTVPEVAAALNRTYSSVFIKARKIGLTGLAKCKPDFIPAKIGPHSILAVSLRDRRRRVLVLCANCLKERWTRLDCFIDKGGPACRSCAQSSGTPARFNSGDIVGNFTVLAVVKPINGGFLYTVRDNRCGHEREARDVPAHPFRGRPALCGCPVRTPWSCGYVSWQWTMPDGRQISVREHRIKIEGVLGRELQDDEHVHHINGVRDDNHPENLELWSSSQPSGQRIEDKIAWAAQLLTRYESDELYAPLVRGLLGGKR